MRNDSTERLNDHLISEHLIDDRDNVDRVFFVLRFHHAVDADLYNILAHFKPTSLMLRAYTGALGESMSVDAGESPQWIALHEDIADRR